MKEAAFTKENAEKWKRYESLIKGRSGISADELANNYINVTDDLAYSSTFYPDSKTTRYLNQLSRSFHAGVYKNKKEQSPKNSIRSGLAFSAGKTSRIPPRIEYSPTISTGSRRS